MGRFHGAYAIGVPIVHAFPFAFDDVGLLTGKQIYTPRVGDVLLDGWVEIDTVFNGTTPKFDAGQIAVGGINTGWWGYIDAPVSLEAADNDGGNGDGLLIGGTGGNNALSVYQMNGQDLINVTRNVPAKFTAATPVKIVVSQDGSIGGASPGSTQGSGVLYLVIVSPV